MAPLPTTPGGIPCTCWFLTEGPHVWPSSKERAALLRSLGVVCRAAWGWAHHAAVHGREHCLTVLLLGVRLQASCWTQTATPTAWAPGSGVGGWLQPACVVMAPRGL